MSASDTFVSVIAALHDDGKILRAFVDEVMPVLHGHYTHYELVLVDDGSTDDTAEVARELLKQHSCVRMIRLAKQSGAEVAIAAGLDSVIGDYVVILNPISNPPALITEVVAKAQQGAGIVVGVKEDRSSDPVWMRLGAWLFHAIGRKMYRWSIPSNTTQLRVLSRQSVNAVTRIKDKQRYLRLLTSLVGFAYQLHAYRPRPAKPKGFFESVALGLNIILTHSSHPLRSISLLGLAASMANLLYVLYVVSIYLFRSHVAEGWTTLSLQTSGMFFLLFLMLSLMGEYIGRIRDEARERPLYYVLEELTSNVLIANFDKRNIAHVSPETKVSR